MCTPPARSGMQLWGGGAESDRFSGTAAGRRPTPGAPLHRGEQARVPRFSSAALMHPLAGCGVGLTAGAGPRAGRAPHVSSRGVADRATILLPFLPPHPTPTPHPISLLQQGPGRPPQAALPPPTPAAPCTPMRALVILGLLLALAQARQLKQREFRGAAAAVRRRASWPPQAPPSRLPTCPACLEPTPHGYQRLRHTAGCSGDSLLGCSLRAAGSAGSGADACAYRMPSAHRLCPPFFFSQWVLHAVL